MSQALAVNQVLDSPEVVTMFDHLEQLVARSETDHTQVFETYLNEYADLAGKVINSFIPVGSHPDMACEGRGAGHRRLRRQRGSAPARCS